MPRSLSTASFQFSKRLVDHWNDVKNRVVKTHGKVMSICYVVYWISIIVKSLDKEKCSRFVWYFFSYNNSGVSRKQGLGSCSPSSFSENWFSSRVTLKNGASIELFWTDCHDTQFRVFFSHCICYSQQILARPLIMQKLWLLLMKLIYGWEPVGNKLNKRNELLITESQCDFFCLIPSAWVKNSKLANTKMTSSPYLVCFANSGLRRMSLFVSRGPRAKHEPELSTLEPASSLQTQMLIFFLFLTSLNFRHSFESYTPLSNVNRKPGSDFDW